jgi:hypothetical protein
MSVAINKFDLALGEEYGNLFAAIMWPTEEGRAPFSNSVRLFFTEEGFELYEIDRKQAIKFIVVDKNIISQIALRNVVILEQNGNDYAQYTVSKVNSPA